MKEVISSPEQNEKEQKQQADLLFIKLVELSYDLGERTLKDTINSLERLGVEDASSWSNKKRLLMMKYGNRVDEYLKGVKLGMVMSAVAVAIMGIHDDREPIVKEAKEKPVLGEVAFPEVQKKLDAEGKFVYTHSDRQTTHILNYLSGREALSDEDNAFLARETVRNDAKVYGIDLPEDFDEFTIEDVGEYVFENQGLFGFEDGPKDAKTMIGFIHRYLEKHFSQKYDDRPELYETLWQMEEQNGSPFIRWTLEEDEYVEDGEVSYVAQYVVDEHAIEISPVTPGDLLSEFSHSQQFANDPLYTQVSDTMESARRMMKELIEQKKSIEAQLEEYHVSGSVEHEAHSEIEPELRASFENELKKKGGDAETIDWYNLPEVK